MKQKIFKFMQGRYGQDALSKLLFFVSLGIYLVGMIGRWMIPMALAGALLIYSTWRMLSRNIPARYKENQSYLALRRRIKAFFTVLVDSVKHRKTHRYYRCPECRQSLRVPRGLGTITVKCPKCRAAFEKKS